MGNCLRKKGKKKNINNSVILETDTNLIENKKDKKNKNNDKDKKNKNKDNSQKSKESNNPLEEILDVKDLQIKGEMLMSESIGKPKELYETIENISPMSYGLIKKVRHKITDKIRAMKIIKKELIEVEEDETIFLKELALLRSLDHPNIIKLYEFYRDEKYFYLLAEYCEYGDLFKIIKQNETGINECTVANIIKQILSAVSYMHAANIINRDLRLENILVQSKETKTVNQNEVDLYNIRIGDFKCARSFKNSKKLNKKVGNPYYIAPEVLKRRYTEKCDIWSCGIIMYILLCGKPPYCGCSEKEVLEMIERPDFKLEFLDEDLRDVSDECKSLLVELLKLDFIKRPSAQEALKHPFFKTHEVKVIIEKDFIVDCLNNLLAFSPDLKFQQAALAFMVHHLTDINEIRDYKNLFELLDTNKDGKLSHKEIIDGFKAIDMKIEKDLQRVIKKIDQDKSDSIEYEEFLRAVIDKEKIICDDKLEKTFKLFDKDGGGSITPDELKTFLGISSKYSDKVWNEIISQIEHKNDNELTLDEFKKMMKLILKKK